MRVVYLKIPRKLHSFAKRMNALNEVVTFYQLKMINSNGYFKDSTIIEKMLESGVVKTESSGYYKLRKCLALGLVSKTKRGYQVVSYDKMFGILGYTLTYNRKRKRKGVFKIHKILETSIHKVKEWIQYVDIRDSLKTQRIRVLKSLSSLKSHPAPLSHNTTKKSKESLDEVVSRDLVQIYKQYREDLDSHIYVLLSGKGKADWSTNLDITLSLNGVCRVLGLTNTSSASKILKNLQELEFLEVEKRLIPTEENIPGAYFKYIDGVRYGNFSNKIRCLV